MFKTRLTKQDGDALKNSLEALSNGVLKNSVLNVLSCNNVAGWRNESWAQTPDFGKKTVTTVPKAFEEAN
ncbi:hypothetical protein [Chryseobacterium lactis]|uniref:hypothetical protein n=1 Tax=Chryseobacterium lactis TaxID=1241981 RepID=UPI00063D297C|nr:hypothetical protein [Chryseobacterium lactis]